MQIPFCQKNLRTVGDFFRFLGFFGIDVRTAGMTYNIFIANNQSFLVICFSLPLKRPFCLAASTSFRSLGF